MQRTRVFQNGNSQAVRIPASMKLSGQEVEIFRRGDEMVIREISTGGLEEAFNLLASLPIDDLRDQSHPQERDGL